MATQRKRTLLAAHDGTERGLEVVARARRIADTADARLLVVHVVDRQTPYWSRAPEYQHLLRDELARVFGPIREIAGPGAETRAVGARSVVEGLLGAIEDEHAGVVVVGSTHRGVLGHALNGDIAQQLAKRCRCYVDLVPLSGRPMTHAA